ncbi:MAG: DUF5715 family protein [Acidobacteriota bacterium]
MMMDGRLARNVGGARGCWVRVLMVVVALVGMSASAMAVRITHPVRARHESAAAPDFSRATARRSRKTDKRDAAAARRAGVRPAGMTHAQAERRLAELRSEKAAAKKTHRLRVRDVEPAKKQKATQRAEVKPSAKVAVKRGFVAAPASAARAVDVDGSVDAQRHEVASALAKAQASADVDGGLNPASGEDAVGAPAVARAPVVSVSADGEVEPDVVKEATAAEAARQKAAIVELAGGNVDSAELARKSAAMKELMRPSHAEMAEEAMAPRIPGLYGRDGRLIMPAALTGSREILIHQNEMADAAGLNRIRTDAQLQSMVAHHLLVSFPETAGLRVNPELPAARRTARPWTVKFAEDTSRAFYKQFHEPLELSSAVRTVAYQRRLQRVNGNAAATSGDAASPHLTGQALDFGKHGMSMEEIAWMRTYLLPLMESGKVDVEEEFQQACFHISVYRSYVRKHDVGEVAENRE